MAIQKCLFQWNHIVRFVDEGLCMWIWHYQYYNRRLLGSLRVVWNHCPPNPRDLSDIGDGQDLAATCDTGGSEVLIVNLEKLTFKD